MTTRDIEHRHWERFFNDFNQMNSGIRVKVESIRDGKTETSRVCNLPLVGIIAVHAERSRNEMIEVVARDPRDDPAIHMIDRPRRVRLAEEGTGSPIAIQIDSDDDAVTIIRFDPPRQNMPSGFAVA